MKYSPKMQKIITRLAQKHTVDLTQPDAFLWLTQPVFQPLVIRSSGSGLVSVAHYFVQNGRYCPDPDVMFYTGLAHWVPIGITNSLGLHRVYATVHDTEPYLCTRHAAHIADLAEFTEQWAWNITDQEWLVNGQSAADDDIIVM